MADSVKCPRCGAELAQDAPAGLCPACLLEQGFGSQPGRSPEPDPATAGSYDKAGEAPQEYPRASAQTAPFTPPGRFVPPLPADLARHFPQLEILELLGYGGMGAVYKARQRQLNRLIALKILPPEVAQEPAFAERFAREAQSLAQLSHPHIVTVHDFGQAGQFFYFIMEFVDGANLRHLISDRKLGQREALAIVPQICEALQYAHDEGVVHRDIKPENLLIDKKGRVKIADFGLAKLLNRGDGGLAGLQRPFTLTGSQQVMGTPHYMAPEQTEQPLAVDHRADIYSLGVVFYEMLTGELPLGRFAAPSQKVQLDVRLDEVVLRSLEKEPQRRYQQASEVKTDVETISRSPRVDSVAKPGEKSETGPVSVPASIPPSRSQPPDRPPLVLVLATLDLVAAAALMLYGLQNSTPLPESTSRLWHVWSIVEIALGFLTSAGLFAASFALLLWKPWARKLVLGVCYFFLAFLIVDLPYLTRVILPLAVEEIRQTAILQGDPAERAEDIVTVGVAIVFGAFWMWLIVHLVYFTRPRVVAAFESQVKSRPAERRRSRRWSVPKIVLVGVVLLGVTLALVAGLIVAPRIFRAPSDATAQLTYQVAGPHVDVSLNGKKLAVTEGNQVETRLRPGDYETTFLKGNLLVKRAYEFVYGGEVKHATELDVDTIWIKGPLTLEFESVSGKPAIADFTAIQGRWTVLAQVKGGGFLLESQRLKWIEFENDRMRSDIPEAPLYPRFFPEARFAIDSSATPRHFDVVDIGAKGIYRLDGDTMTLAVADAGQPRPTDFVSPSGSLVTLTLCRRAKAATSPPDSGSSATSAPETEDTLVRFERIGDIADPAGVPIQHLAVQEKHAYLIQGDAATGIKSLRAVDISEPSRLRMMGSFPLTAEAGHLAVLGNYVYILDSPNLQVVDVSDPAALRHAGSCELGEGLWDLAIQGRFAYVTDVESVRVIDLENPSAPKQVGRCEMEEAQGIAVAGQYAYVACNVEGMHVVDISDPTAPKDVDVFKEPQGAADVAVAGKYAYIVGGEDAVTLWVADVSDPKRPKGVGKFGDWIQGSVVVQGDLAYLAGSDLDIVDISNPSAPKRAGSFPKASDVAVDGDYVYVANDEGFWILRRVSE